MYNFLALASHACIKSVPVPLSALLYTCISLNQYLSLNIEGFPTNDAMGASLWCHWGSPSPTTISFGTNTNIHLFVYLFCHYSETFFHTCIHCFPIGWTTVFNHFKTIKNPLVTKAFQIVLSWAQGSCSFSGIPICLTDSLIVFVLPPWVAYKTAWGLQRGADVENKSCPLGSHALSCKVVLSGSWPQC